MHDRRSARYFLAMIYKKLGKYEKASVIYLDDEFHYKIQLQEGFNMMKQIVGCILLPMCKEKVGQTT